MAVVWFILVGLHAGWRAGKSTKGSGFGLPGNLFVGVIGALPGGFLFRVVGIAVGGLPGKMVIATISAAVLLYLLRLIMNPEENVMQKAISLALIAVGVILLVFGYDASQSISSEVTRVVTGSPSDKAMWLIGGGAAATVAGIAGLFLGKK